ncbi:MAG: DNA recombination protein RmuC [Arsenophonus endosymbiont of Ceratovacuna japonica]
MDIQLLYITIAFFSGVFFGSSLILFITLQKINEKEIELRKFSNIKVSYDEKITNIEYWKNEYKQCNQKLELQIKINHIQEIELREIIIRLEETKSTFKDKEKILYNSQQWLNIQFENLANRIFEKNEYRISKYNKESLISLLTPLREQIDNFSNQINKNFNKEERERYNLLYEIHKFQQLSINMVKETINLTKALKGDNKIQGNWGETILTRILETSGLRKGYEFETQVSINEVNKRHQLDVIIHLPQKKDIVIDSKMSLIDYENYFNSKDEQQQKISLQKHINSIRNHIKDLGQKNYHKLNGLRSLDYILMFIPIEPAYLIALREAPGLIDEGLRNNILLVCPSTLLVTIRIIDNLWRYEKQSKNSQAIVDRAAKIYDKIRLFIDDMQLLGQSLSKANINYQSAIKKLLEGKGNLISQTESLKELGIEVKRQIYTEFNK